LQVLNSHDGLFESFAYDLFLLLELMHLFVSAPQRFAPNGFLGSQLVEFFVLGHAATLAELPVIPQLHSPTE
jgi:hypothetical protein